MGIDYGSYLVLTKDLVIRDASCMMYHVPALTYTPIPPCTHPFRCLVPVSLARMQNKIGSRERPRLKQPPIHEANYKYRPGHSLMQARSPLLIILKELLRGKHMS